nr:MAG TPA: hypothetical protein [Caudoviricetes sp.]
MKRKPYASMREISLEVRGHEHEIGSLKHRAKDLEEEVKGISKLTLSVEKMAVNMELMLKELSAQGERLGKLENKETDQYRSIKNAAVIALVSGSVGAFLAKVLAFL